MKPALDFGSKHSAFVSLGSNTPDKEERISKAMATLQAACADVKCSDVYSTPCFRGVGDDYLNAVISLTTEMSLQDLEAYFKDLEREAGRIHDDAHKNIVALDIDVVVWDGGVVRPKDFERKYFARGYRLLADPRNIRIEDFNYDLPDGRIARHPLARRDQCKLLVINRKGIVADTVFADIARYVPHDSLLIYNDTKVINARLKFIKETGAAIEIFCLEPIMPVDYQLNFSSTGPVRWKCLVGNSKRWNSGDLTMPLNIDGLDVLLTARRVSKEGADSIVEFSWTTAGTNEIPENRLSFSEIIAVAGQIPIPPYLGRGTEDSDRSDYQTVYSHVEGSVAAPTAGLHFTDSLLRDLSLLGIGQRQVTLHVGAGTFQPVKADSMEGHDMHSELIDVPRGLIEELSVTDRPVTAVGTTSVRTLESLYHIGCKMATGTWTGELDQWYPYDPEHPRLTVAEALRAITAWLDRHKIERLVTSTRIIIAPSYRYRIVDNIITNFHQPSSTLLLLVSAIVGDNWKEIYNYALANDYRFLSYGDACLFLDVKA